MHRSFVTPKAASVLIALTGLALVAGATDTAPQSDDAPTAAPPAADLDANTAPNNPERLAGSFTYQGRLRSAGLPANGDFDMTFQLADAPVVGFLLQQIDIANVPVTNGLFQVDLAFDPAHFDGDARWLAVRVEGQTLSPRQQILPTPYAMTADTLEVPATLSGSGTVFTALSSAGTGVTGRHTNPNGIQAGVVGTTDSQSPDAQGVLGQINSAAPGTYSAGVRGISNGTGFNGIGVYGSQAGFGWGVYGTTPGGRGVYGESANGTGVVGDSSSGVGVSGSSTTGVGVQGDTDATASNAAAVRGVINSTSPGSLSAGVRGINNGTGGTGIGVYGSHAGTGWGVYGRSESGQGVRGFSPDGIGVVSTTSTGTALVATNSGTDTRAELASPGYGVYATNHVADAVGTGIFGEGGEFGVEGTTTSTGFGTRTGVFGYASGEQSGINLTRGVYGFAFANYFDGNREAYGVFGSAASGGDGTGSNRAYGVYGEATGTGANWAGYFDGRVHVNGTLSKNAGAFKIDHPLDPTNKFLIHSFVESPDMMNIYNGVATFDNSGIAEVELPEYFEALNRDYRYQLTAIGAPMPDLFIAQEVASNTFVIGGGLPGKRVSWEVTGIRQDAYANANRLINEVDKQGDELGRYLNPEAFGRPWEEGIQGHRLRQTRQEQDAKRRGNRAREEDSK